MVGARSRGVDDRERDELQTRHAAICGARRSSARGQRIEGWGDGREAVWKIKGFSGVP